MTFLLLYRNAIIYQIIFKMKGIRNVLCSINDEDGQKHHKKGAI